jgi:hypothetical protein
MEYSKPKNWSIFIKKFSKNAQSKQSPNRRKFAQSGQWMYFQHWDIFLFTIRTKKKATYMKNLHTDTYITIGDNAGKVHEEYNTIL